MTQSIQANALAQPSLAGKFDRGYRWLHWIMAALIFLMFFAIQGFATALTPEDHMAMLLGHSSMGTIISMLLFVRVSKRFVKRDPVPTPNIPALQKMAARTAQYGLYLCMFLVPVSGYLTARSHELPVMLFGSFNLSQSQIQGYNEQTFALLRNIHEWGITAIMVLIAMHVGAALFHRIVKKDDVLQMMLPAKRVKK